jgi:hypothetical protein
MKVPWLNSSEQRIDFCERNGRVCDARCRSSAIRDRAVERALAGRFGVR